MKTAVIGTILGILLSAFIALTAFVAHGDEGRSYYRTSTGVTKGWTRVSAPDRIVAEDYTGKTLGWYNPKRDITFDSTGQDIGSGNSLSSLIDQAYAAKTHQR